MELHNANIDICTLFYKYKIIRQRPYYSDYLLAEEILILIMNLYKKYNIMDNYYYDGYMILQDEKAQSIIYLYIICGNYIKCVRQFNLKTIPMEVLCYGYAFGVNELNIQGSLIKMDVWPSCTMKCINVRYILYLGNLLVLTLSTRLKYINNLPIELYNYIKEEFLDIENRTIINKFR